MSALEVWHKQFGVKDHVLQDSAWLKLFVKNHDGEAFAKLVQRHAAMVHAVCRRVLGNVADAEDATQAAFLILAQRAQSIRNKADIGGWLFGVARRVALQSLRQRQRREARERLIASHSADNSPDLLAAREAALLCDAELLKLPMRYRQALVLCCVEGLSKSMAARRLGWPEGTVASCVSRGKKLLADRLIRRGVLPALAAAVLSTPAVHAVPASLGNVATPALALVAGRSLTHLALPGAIQLFYKVQSTMLFQRRLLFLLCSVCLVLAGPGLLWSWNVFHAPAEELAESAPVTQTDNPASDSRKAETDFARLQGRWKLVATVSHSQQPVDPFSGTMLGSMLEFKDNEFIQILVDGKVIKSPEIVFRINERVQPKELDVEMGKQGKSFIIPGLYALDTDTLVICTSNQVTSRPIEIGAARNGSTKIAIYRRVPTPGVPTAEEVRMAEELMLAKIGKSLQACVIAMHNYHSDYTRLPEAAIFDKKTGQPLLSWRVKLLPYLEPALDNVKLYKEFHLDEPWDSDHNKKLIPRMPAIFALPDTKAAKEFKTHYRIFVAPAKTPEGKNNLFAPCFTLSATERPTLGQLTVADGTSNTIALVEASDAVIWTKPDELIIEHDEAPIPSLGASPNSPYFVACHFDAANHLYKRVKGPVAANETYYKILRQMIGWKDGMNYDPSPIQVR